MVKPYLVSVTFDFEGQRGLGERLGGNGKPYSFKCTVPNVRKGDLVVVKCSTGYQVCKVLKVVATEPPPEATAYIVAILDIEDHERQIKQAEKYEELSARIELRIEEAAKEKTLAKLAKSDPALADLLKERDNLNG